MSLNSLKIATDGYLKRTTTKAVLIIAVAGYLNFGGTPVPPTSSGGSRNEKPISSWDHQENKIKKVKEEDMEVLEIIKIWVSCH